jgi:hypothetical protein
MMNDDEVLATIGANAKALAEANEATKEGVFVQGPSTKYRNVNGFGDDTDFVEVHADGRVTLTLNDGSVVPATEISRADCELFLRRGAWKIVE